MKVVCTSGYFNPFHVGHLELLEASKKLGDYLIVIVNNDHQVRLKGAVPFMNENERARIIRALKCVDHVMVASDRDRTVVDTLRSIRPQIFAKGGDSEKSNTPEEQICREYGIQIVYGVGGGKIQASSKLIQDARAWQPTTKHGAL